MYVFRNIQEEKEFVNYFFEEVRNMDDSNNPVLKVMKLQKQSDHGVYTRHRAMQLYDCVKLDQESSRLKIDPAFWRV